MMHFLLLNDGNVDANVVIHDPIVVTNDETISINETHITPPAHSLNRETICVHAPLRMGHAPYALDSLQGSLICPCKSNYVPLSFSNN